MEPRQPSPSPGCLCSAPLAAPLLAAALPCRRRPGGNRRPSRSRRSAGLCHAWLLACFLLWPGLGTAPAGRAAARSVAGVSAAGVSPAAGAAAERRPAGASADARQQTWIQQAEGLEARGAYAEAAALWERIVAWRERALGAQHPETATALHRLAWLYTMLGRLQAAEPLNQRALRIREQQLPASHADIGSSLNNLGLLYTNLGRFSEAEGLLKRALASAEQSLGPRHPDTAIGLGNLAMLYSRMGRLQEARALSERSLAIRETQLGPEHPLTAESLTSLALLDDQLGRYGEGLRHAARALAIRERQLEQHPDTASGLHLLARLNERLARHEQAEGLYRRALRMREQLFHPDHPAIGASLNNLALLQETLGRYEEAEAGFRRALAIAEKAYGEQHPDTAISINNLASVLERQGRYGNAEGLFQRSIAIQANSLGQDHPITAGSQNRLALLYAKQGRSQEAEALLKAALASREKALPSGHPEIGANLNDLALLYTNTARNTEAETLLRRALKIAEKVLGATHPDTAASLNNLALLYDRMGRPEQAEPLYLRALRAQESALGAEHPTVAISLSNLALSQIAQGKAEAAEPLARRALLIRETLLGPMHPETATSLNTLAGIAVLKGDRDAARPLLERLSRQQADWLRRELPLQPRALRSTLLAQQPEAITSVFALLDQDAASAPLALETRLNRHGLLAEIEQRQRLLASHNAASRGLAEQLAGIDQRLAAVTLPPPRRLELQEQRQRLEAELYRQLPALRLEPVSTAEVSAALKVVAPEGLLVEFQKFSPFRRDDRGRGVWGQQRYVALLLRPDGRLRAIPLGEAAAIDAAVAAALSASADANRQEEAQQRLEAVSARLLAPLQEELVGVRELFLSPDGELHRLPFAALPAPGQGGRTLAETIPLRLLTSGRELLRLQQPAPAGRAAVLVANPDFDSRARRGSGVPAATAREATAVPMALRGRPADGALRGLAPWQPLPGSEQEGRLLTALLRPGTVVTGPQATAARVLQLRSPRLLHIATHGFFLADPPAETPAPTGSRAGPRTVLPGELAATEPAAGHPGADEPLERSGLVFAGANHPDADPADDGYLTAAEVTGMDLAGTELVTLSACETGLGGVRSGEGVYGLQRSLAVAGARSTLLSLWKVDDALTAAFMAEFYRRLQAGAGRAAALQQTQAHFRNHRDSTLNDVRIWGAFQLSGDWRALPGWAGRSAGR